MSHVHLAAEKAVLRRQSTPLSYLWRINYLDGTLRKFTIHDQELSLHEDPGYRPSNGLEGFAIRKEAGLKSQSTELRGSFDVTGKSVSIPATDFRARRIANAYAYCTLINSDFPFAGRGIARFTFRVVDYEYDEHEWRLQLQGLMHRLDYKRGEAYAPECLNQLGVVNQLTSFCHYALRDVYPQTVDGCGVYPSSPTPNRQTFEVFRVLTNPLSQSIHPDGYFSFGLILWTEGANTGKVEVIEKSEVGRDQNSQIITVARPMPFQVTGNNDVCRLVVGCDKRADTCRDKFNQFDISYRGTPHIPGALSALRNPAAD